MSRLAGPREPLERPVKVLCLHGQVVRPGERMVLRQDGWLGVLLAAGQPKPGWVRVRCHEEDWQFHARDIGRMFDPFDGWRTP